MTFDTSSSLNFPERVAHLTEYNLAYISKVIEEAVEQQVAQLIDTQGLADLLQSAYETGHSTETVLLKLCNDILLELELDSSVVCLGMLDLSAVFCDRSPRDTLTPTQGYINITDDVAKLLQS